MASWNLSPRVSFAAVVQYRPQSQRHILNLNSSLFRRSTAQLLYTSSHGYYSSSSYHSIASINLLRTFGGQQYELGYKPIQIFNFTYSTNKEEPGTQPFIL